MPVDPAALVDAENDLRAAVVDRVEQTARQMLRDYLIANPAQTPRQVLLGMFPNATLLVDPDNVIDAIVIGVRTENIGVGAQRRLTWTGP